MVEKSLSNEMLILRFKQSRNAYVDFANLYAAIEKFENNPTDKNTDLLKLYIMVCSNGMPLPSGRWGNQLAVALEMQKYIAALYMIENAEQLGIDLEYVSSIFGGKDVWDVSMVYELSKQSFEFVKIDLKDDDYRDYLHIVKHKNTNIDAAMKIEEVLDKKYPKRNKLK